MIVDDEWLWWLIMMAMNFISNITITVSIITDYDGGDDGGNDDGDSDDDHGGLV